MKRVTRNIDPGCTQDLLARVPRASLGFACDHGPQAQPVVVVWQDGRYLAGLPLDISCRPGAGQEVVLLIDKGMYFFDLRTLYIRGCISPAEVPRGMSANHIWVEIIPLKAVAWDYGMLREVKDEH